MVIVVRYSISVPPYKFQSNLHTIGSTFPRLGLLNLTDEKSISLWAFLFFQSTPFTGDHFELELSRCNSNNFQVFLDEFSKLNHEEFNRSKNGKKNKVENETRFYQ